MKRILTAIILLTACSLTAVQAQQYGGIYDPMLTMYSFQPQNINPALVGNQNHKWKMTAIYREQSYIPHEPFRTTSASFDMNAPINAWSGNIWGFGISGLDDRQGDAFLRTTNVLGSFSIGQYLDPRLTHSISIGFQGGIASRAIDYTEAYWDRQWVGEGFDTEVDAGEPLLGDVRNYFDLSTGVQYSYFSGDLVEFTGGVGVFHVTRPDVSLYGDTANTKLSRRATVHLDFVHRIRDNSMFALRPSVLYSRQAQRGNFRAGTDFQFLFNEGTRTTGKRSESSISFGLFGRVAFPGMGTVYDVLGTISMEFAGFSVGAGYDIPVGTYNTINGYEGAFEFMLSYRAGFRRGLYNKYSPRKKGKL
jgi:type IX secretion system PorP/SprF family membrane protein